MMASDLRTILGGEVIAALDSLGVTPVEAFDISGRPSEASARATLKLVLEDGRAVKVRRYARPARARRAARLLGLLCLDHLPRVLLFAGRVMVEEWIDGLALSHLSLSEERLGQAANLLGCLHGTRMMAGRPLFVPQCTRPLRRRAERQLVGLVAAGAIRDYERRLVFQGLARFAPERAVVGLTHHDFCAENLVEDPHGRIFAVDNEHMRVGFIEFDLARTWYRWPMPQGAWGRFLDHYTVVRGAELDLRAWPFWQMAALVYGAHVRSVRWKGAQIDVPLRKLRDLITELG